MFLLYVFSYLDRINIGFAKLQLQDVLGVDAAVFNSVYGLGAGLFFIGYFIFEVPSNLILHRVGARVWIARIMIVWGLVSMAFMFLNGVTFFYVMRFLLGVAEAGFFPGIILYLTYWFPARERARTIALFALGGVAAGVIGSPVGSASAELLPSITRGIGCRIAPDRRRVSVFGRVLATQKVGIRIEVALPNDIQALPLR